MTISWKATWPLSHFKMVQFLKRRIKSFHSDRTFCYKKCNSVINPLLLEFGKWIYSVWSWGKYKTTNCFTPPEHTHNTSDLIPRNTLSANITNYIKLSPTSQTNSLSASQVLHHLETQIQLLFLQHTFILSYPVAVQFRKYPHTDISYLKMHFNIITACKPA